MASLLSVSGRTISRARQLAGENHRTFANATKIDACENL
jgi:hypothetical protein